MVGSLSNAAVDTPRCVLFLKGMIVPHEPASRSSSRTGLPGVVWFSLPLFFVPQGPVSQIRLVEAGSAHSQIDSWWTGHYFLFLNMSAVVE